MQSIREAYHRYLRYFLSKDDATATIHDRYMALAYAVRSEMVDHWIETQNHYHRSTLRRVYCLSPEYILGKSLQQNIISLGLLDEVRDAAARLGFSLEQVLDEEDDLELGSGGKGRQAAILLEAMATRGLPAMGYGVRYDYGLFRQHIVNGTQVEVPYDWLHREHPWEIMRPEYLCTVHFGGASQPKGSPEKTAPHTWKGAETVFAVPTDVPIPGHLVKTVNTLRLWSAKPAEEFPPDYANHGDYVRACEDTSQAGRITRVLYPEGDVLRSTLGRIRLHYFLVSTSLQDIIRRYKADHLDVNEFDRKVTIQLAGSSSALAVPELMRLLVDVEEVPWLRAWDITRGVFSYTSNAVSREHLEFWPLYMLEQLLPRHLEILYEINQMHLDQWRTSYGSDLDTIRELSIIEEGEVKRLKMSNLAILGGSSVHAVSHAQKDVLAGKVFPVLLGASHRPVHAVTNGVAHRRWLLGQNSGLAALITEAIGEGWVTHAEELAKLEPLAADAAFLERFGRVKQANKEQLLVHLKRKLRAEWDPAALFDVQCTRIHPYKRQMLNLLHIVARYLDIKAGKLPAQKRLHLFAGKAMPTDFLAKQSIALIHIVSDIVNGDRACADHLAVGFVPDFGLTWADRMFPAIDLGEELGAPNQESCPTSQYNLVCNGGVPIIARGGAHEELIAAVGAEQVFAFGDVGVSDGVVGYQPFSVLSGNQRLLAVFNFLEEQLAAHHAGDSVFPLISSIRDTDRFRVLADFDEYSRQQELADAAYQDRPRWLGMALTNIARSGIFSADRAVEEFARLIWKVTPTGL
jgi:glycogen phosphorylase